MCGIPVSEKYRDITNDGIIYRGLAKYCPQHKSLHVDEISSRSSAYITTPNINARNDGHFAYGTLRLLDSSPTVWSFCLLDSGHFAYWSFRLRDISPTGQFAYWTVRLLDIFPTTWIGCLQIALHFTNKTTRVK